MRVVAVLLGFGLACGAPQAAAAESEVSVVAAGLEHPWSLALLKDGRALITERSGRLRLLQDGALDPEPIAGVPAVHFAGQGGLFEVLPARDFASSGMLYLSYAHRNDEGNTTRLARARLADGELHDLQVLFDAQPRRATAVHYGGRMAWMGDGTLLLTLGDGFDYREQAQDRSNHLGSIVRLRADGSVPGDNPFVGQPLLRPEIYSYGHRNVQGVVVLEDRVLIHEHGPRGGDEINRLLPGRNYGWPMTTFGIDYSGAMVSPYTELPGVEAPLLHWTPSIAPAGFAYYYDARFPAWQGSLFVTALAERSLRRVRFLADGQVEQERLLGDRGQRLRDVRLGADGALYLLTDGADAELLRLSPPSAALSPGASTSTN